MTSHFIKSHTTREIAPSWKSDHGNTATPGVESCIFCRIVQNVVPSFKIYEDEHVLAFLDILPIRQGHTLVVSKIHCKRVSELPPDVASAMGAAVSKVANALTNALGNTALNVVCNQEYAQSIPHVHYHIVPAPVFDNPDHAVAPVIPLTNPQIHRKEFCARKHGELDDEEGHELCQLIRSKL